MLGLRVLLWQSDGLEEKALLPQYLVHGNDGPTSQTDFFVDSLLETAKSLPRLVIAVVEDNPAEVYFIEGVLQVHGLQYGNHRSSLAKMSTFTAPRPGITIPSGRSKV